MRPGELGTHTWGEEGFNLHHSVQGLKSIPVVPCRSKVVQQYLPNNIVALAVSFTRYMWYPIAGPSPIAVHGPISGPKDLYRAVDRYRARSYRSKRLELRFAVAVHSPIAVHGPITVQPEFFKFPRRNLPLGICLSTDFSAFSSFRRETCESTSLSALIFVPFQEQNKVWRGLPGIFVRCVVLFFFFFLFDTVRCLFKRRREKVWRGTPWFKLKKVTFTERQTCFLNVNLLLSRRGVWAG